MSNIDKYRANVFNRDEFLTPFDRLFDEVFAAHVPSFTKEFGVDFFEKGSYPRVDIIDHKNTIEIQAEIPGLSKEDVSVEVIDNVLTVSGNKTAKSFDKTPDDFSNYLRRELKRSSFRRSFTLGDNVDKSKIDAKFENGILTVTLSKVQPSKPEVKKVEIK